MYFLSDCGRPPLLKGQFILKMCNDTDLRMSRPPQTGISPRIREPLMTEPGAKRNSLRHVPAACCSASSNSSVGKTIVNGFMNRYILSVVVTSLMGCIYGRAYDGVSNWMSRLNDAAYIHKVSIPGPTTQVSRPGLYIVKATSSVRSIVFKNML